MGDLAQRLTQVAIRVVSARSDIAVPQQLGCRPANGVDWKPRRPIGPTSVRAAAERFSRRAIGGSAIHHIAVAVLPKIVGMTPGYSSGGIRRGISSVRKVSAHRGTAMLTIVGPGPM